MINTKEFYDYLINNNLDFFAGVPDSLLKNLGSCILDNAPQDKHVIAANEGNAIAIACGYNIATDKIAVAYMQNSGLGNAVNPLLSLADVDVYNIPVLMIIGWRGEPGEKDEPQHLKQGELTIPLLETLGIKHYILNDNYTDVIDKSIKYMQTTNKPVALVVKKNTFSQYKNKLEQSELDLELQREEALKIIIDNIADGDFVVSTTGKTSREIFEIRKENNQSHSQDFLTVGSMGHTSSIALGMSLGTNKKIYCIDGDGSFIMHMGASAINTQLAKDNFKYIIINNGAHESVGGQPTVAFSLDMENLLKSLGFKNVYIAQSQDEIKQNMKKLNKEKLSALIINTKQGSRKDLGRPTINPKENKENLMQEMKR